MWWDTVRYVSFLVVLWVWAWTFERIDAPDDNASSGPARPRDWWLELLRMAMFWTLIFSVVWVISGVTTWSVLLVGVVATAVGSLLGTLIAVLIGRSEASTWVIARQNVDEHPVLTGGAYLITRYGIVLFLGGVAVVNFFAADSDKAADVLLVTLLWVILGLLGRFGTQALILASPYLNQQTREFAIWRMVVDLIPLYVMTSIVLSGLGVGGAGGPLSGVRAEPTSILWTVVVLFAWFSVTTMIPYVVGTVSAARFARFCVDRRRQLLSEAGGALARPQPGQFLDGLQAVRGAARKDCDDLLSAHSFLKVDPDVGNSPGGDEAGEVDGEKAERWARSVKADPRFHQLSWLRRFSGEVRDAERHLEGQLDDEAAVVRDAQVWASSFDRQRADAVEPPLAGRRAFGMVVALGLLNVIASTVIGGLGAQLWDSFNAAT